MSASHMGAMLRERREELGISLEMAATATNIRARVLAVLEDGDYANFPPYGHAMGMISSYARYLETDPRPILQEFEREWTDFENGSRIAESADRTRRGVGRFGERAVSSERPSQRSQRFAREGRSSGSLAEATGSIHAKLDDEKLAEEDDRYKSGTVKVVGTRQTGDFHRIGARPPRHVRSDSSEGERGPRSERGASSLAARERGADRLFDRGSSTTGDARGSRRGGERGASASRVSSRYSRYSSGRYTSRSGTRSESRAGSTGASKRVQSSTRGVRELPHRGRAVEDSGAQESARAAADTSRANSEQLDSKVPDYFSVEKLDRADRARAERQPSRKRTREGDETRTADEGIVARLVSLVQEAFSEKRTRAIAIGIVAFVVVVCIVAGVLISTAGNNDSGVIAVEGGAADTSKSTSNPNSASATVTTTNGNPVNVSIDVADGQTSLINVTYDDDNAYSGTAVGAWHREFLVTESLEATFGNPDAVTVTENGNPVNIDKSSDGTGKMSITIKTTSTSTSNGSSESTTGKKSSKKSSKKNSSSSSSSSSS